MESARSDPKMDSKLDSIILLLLTRESNLLTPLLTTPKTRPQGNKIPYLSTQIKKLRRRVRTARSRHPALELTRFRPEPTRFPPGLRVRRNESAINFISRLAEYRLRRSISSHRHPFAMEQVTEFHKPQFLMEPNGANVNYPSKAVYAIRA